jgi:hypothetical protein
MTIVAGVVTKDDICMVADCRLSIVDHRGQLHAARDVCQKLIVANGWSLVGFAGDLCLGRDLLRCTVNRIRATPHTDARWLRSDDAILDFIQKSVRLHRREKADHRPCQRRRVDLMIGWLDYGQFPMAPNMEVISISSPQLTVKRLTFGIDVIGSGIVVED